MERFSASVSGKAIAILLLVGFSNVALACGAEATQPAVPATPIAASPPTGASSEAAAPAVAAAAPTPTAAHRVFSDEYIKLSDTSLIDLPEEEARRLRAQIVATINQLPEAYSHKIRSVSVGLVSDANITMR